MAKIVYSMTPAEVAGWWDNQAKIEALALNPPPPVETVAKRRRRRPRRKSIDTLTQTDLVAVAAVRSWGVQETVVFVRPVRCGRQDCGGSVLTFENERACLLCARNPRGLAVAI